VARETSGSPTPPPQSITVQDAIEEAPATELKRLMQRVVADVPEARTLIEAAPLRPLGNGSELTSGLKRKATEECKHCHEFYQIEDNKKGVCRYRPCKSFDTSEPANFQSYSETSCLTHSPLRPGYSKTRSELRRRYLGGPQSESLGGS
jgi:hypothetical protein